MTQDFFMAQLRVVLLVTCAYCAGAGYFSTETNTFIGAISVPMIALFGPWLWSIYRNVNMKLVPKNSVAVTADQAEISANGTHAVITGATTLDGGVLAKVVGVLLFAFVLSAFLAGGAQAQVKLVKPTGDLVRDIEAVKGNAPAPTASAASASPVDKAVSSFNDGIQKITKDLVDKAIADVTAAQTDAQNHNDQISKPCWDANLTLLKSLPSQWENPPPSPLGVALAIQIQRDLLNAITGNDATSLKVACAALWGDQLKIVGQLGALLGVRIATGGLF